MLSQGQHAGIMYHTQDGCRAVEQQMMLGCALNEQRRKGVLTLKYREPKNLFTGSLHMHRSSGRLLSMPAMHLSISAQQV